MKRFALLLAVPMALGLSCPAHAVQGSEQDILAAYQFPTERSMGVSAGLIGPGVAYRQFLTPELGFQVGANTFWLPGYGVVSGGGQLMFSPFHRGGNRFYLEGGIGYTVGSPLSPLTPGIGVGYSQAQGQYAMWFADLTLLMLGSGNIYYPQVGYMFSF